MDPVNFIGFIIIIIFIIYLYKLIQNGPYIQRKSNKYRIKIWRKKFEPDFLVIKKGDTISWKNYDIIRHTVYTNLPNIPNSQVLEPDREFDYTFTMSGKFTFQSSLYKTHEPMNIIVKNVTEGNSFINSFKNNFQIMYNNIFLYTPKIMNYINNLIYNVKKSVIKKKNSVTKTTNTIKKKNSKK